MVNRDLHEALISPTTAYVTGAFHAKLHNYRTSFPTGVFSSKVWRRGETLCWYTHSPKGEGYCHIDHRELVVTDAAEPPAGQKCKISRRETACLT